MLVALTGEQGEGSTTTANVIVAEAMVDILQIATENNTNSGQVSKQISQRYEKSSSTKKNELFCAIRIQL